MTTEEKKQLESAVGNALNDISEDIVGVLEPRVIATFEALVGDNGVRRDRALFALTQALENWVEAFCSSNVSIASFLPAVAELEHDALDEVEQLSIQDIKA